MQDREDRIVGVLLGLAAGDRIGGPVRMALRVAESLVDQRALNMIDIGSRYLDWWRDGAFDTGPTVARVLTLVDSGASFAQASAQVDEDLGGMTAGCNPAHRLAPLAMCRWLDDPALDRAAIEESRLTHGHPLAGEVAAEVVRLCRALIRGTAWPAALRGVADGCSPEIRRALESAHAGELSRGGFAPEVLRAAVHFVDSADSLSAALVRSIDFAGPANYCPVLVGSIGGARWGRRQIEDDLLQHHKLLIPRLTAAALDLAAGWRDPDARAVT